jgi:quinol monooxygenase YgiN
VSKEPDQHEYGVARAIDRAFAALEAEAKAEAELAADPQRQAVLALFERWEEEDAVEVSLTLPEIWRLIAALDALEERDGMPPDRADLSSPVFTTGAKLALASSRWTKPKDPP